MNEDQTRRMALGEMLWPVMGRSTTVNVLGSIDHGPGHWARVWRNAHRLANSVEGVDRLVLDMFALFHDSMRDNEFVDPHHGSRGSKLAIDLGIQMILGDEQVDLFQSACIAHDAGLTTLNPTVGVCWDADRLDLPRVGIQVDPMYLSTHAAKEEILNG